jgi:hypothetical protein
LGNKKPGCVKSPVEIISQALGNTDFRTTDNYLKSFGDSVLDDADRLLD